MPVSQKLCKLLHCKRALTPAAIVMSRVRSICSKCSPTKHPARHPARHPASPDSCPGDSPLSQWRSQPSREAGSAVAPTQRPLCARGCRDHFQHNAHRTVMRAPGATLRLGLIASTSGWSQVVTVPAIIFASRHAEMFTICNQQGERVSKGRGRRLLYATERNRFQPMPSSGPLSLA